MWQEDLFGAMEKEKDVEQASHMAAYMQNRFLFLGIPKPKLKTIMQPFLKSAKKEALDWNFVMECWNKEYREAQYVAISYLAFYEKKMPKESMRQLEYLITHKSWWETVDSIDSMVGNIVLRYPEEEKTMLAWSVSENIWLRRVAIDYQQEYKNKTNEEMLEQIIKNNFGSDEFFINKAIGWSLRDYSKTNPIWVSCFLEKYRDQIAPLSFREASKYL